MSKLFFQNRLAFTVLAASCFMVFAAMGTRQTFGMFLIFLKMILVFLELILD